MTQKRFKNIDTLPVLCSKAKEILENIKKDVNNEYGFHNDMPDMPDMPRINYGPCGVFAQVFFKKWNKLFDKRVTITFLMDKIWNDCDHILVRLPSGELYDGGHGIQTDIKYLSKYFIDNMIEYDEVLLEKWSYGLKRSYPGCPNFNRKVIEKIVNLNLNNLKNQCVFKPCCID